MALRNIHLVPEDEDDDLYSGYDDSTLDQQLEDDPEFQRIVRTQYGQRPPLPTAQKRLGTSRVTGTGAFRLGTGRLATGFAAEPDQARPVTSTRAAGFTSAGPVYDPMNHASTVPGKPPIPPLDPRPEDSPEERIRQLEKKVNKLLEDSVNAFAAGDYQLALDKAKESSRKERLLCKQREQASLADQINLDLTYCVLFNLANQYHANKMHEEAHKTYLLIVKNKLFGSGGRLRLNMGNLFFEQKKYPLAIKMYRMALDQIPDTHREMRLRILQNICTVYVRLGQYNDAVSTYEHIMNETRERADFKTAMNLLLCYYAIGDREKQKRHFQRMTQLTCSTDPEDNRYYLSDESDHHERMLLEVMKQDTLRKIELEERAKAEHSILTAAKLIAPVIEASFASGFDWCIEVVKSSQHSELASELEITKALTYLRQSNIPKAVETLKDCGRKDSKMASTAATNLSFVFFLEGDIPQAEKHADTAIQLDHYNPHALVNKGNCLYAQSRFEKACDFYQEAQRVEATCTEALYNLGLAYKRLGQLDRALECFNKLQTIFKNLPEVIYQLADVYDKLDDFHQATEWFMQLVSLVPTDPGVLQRMGELYDAEEDRSQAFQYYYESHRYSPTNIDVLSWLGAYYMDSQYCDKAVQYFECATLIQPNQVNWQLMVASCHRKTGNYPLALQCYRDIHQHFPDNIDCLRFLVRLSTDMGLKEAQEYSLLLQKVEKSREAKRQRELSGGSHSSGSGSGRGSSRKPPLPTDREVSNARSERRSRKENVLQASNVTNIERSSRPVDSSYADPIGDLPERPRTAARTKPVEDHDFDDAELGDDLLPQ